MRILYIYYNFKGKPENHQTTIKGRRHYLPETIKAKKKEVLDV
jgi:hypothetical protein